MTKTITIILDENETSVLLNLLDFAVKAAGRSAAEAVVHFERKIKVASEAKEAAESAIKSA